ncbi:glycine betaine ABC transporter substrate-binding protein [Derxia gummosa]|uniref:Glycine betaine ABC transporter substrate-binding protein n=1 Tax=Derxia gummosa DSM 723 TaxID=1121388 RepID=A0A8B6XBL6_9BURK|nr:glycine betaine ABC transporter substrate-binding protein [Derxia gummosa]
MKCFPRLRRGAAALAWIGLAVGAGLPGPAGAASATGPASAAKATGPTGVAKATGAAGTAAPPATPAAEPESCATVRLASPGWADIDATNALLTVVLKALGYRPTVQILSVPMTYQGLRGARLDAFLGNWMPAQRELIEPLLADGGIERIARNLEQARFTLAVFDYSASAGVRGFDDLAAHADDFGRRIYGIEAGAPANESIKRMLADPARGLAGWRLVESSDAGLLAQMGHEFRARRPMVFLAWEPHVMNTRYPISYLKGGDAWFGPGGGLAEVHTVTRRGYRTQCPNVGRLLGQLRFSVALENELIGQVIDKRLPPEEAARRVLAREGALAGGWLAGVSARDGGDAKAKLAAALAN